MLGFRKGVELVLDCDFLRPEQGWQCERQMVLLGVALTSPGSSQHINKQTGPSQRGLGSGSYQSGRRAGECGRHRRVGDRERSDFWEWWDGRCVLVEVQSSIHMSHPLLPGKGATSLGSELLEGSVDGMLPCSGNQLQGASGI